MEKKEMTCIVCPIGCQLEVRKNEQAKEGYDVTGNQCPRGVAYGIKEMKNPTRVLTSTVKIIGAKLPRLPVSTKGPIPKGLMMDAMKEINLVEVTAPVEIGQVIIKNVLNTGVNIVASRSMKKVSSVQSESRSDQQSRNVS